MNTPPNATSSPKHSVLGRQEADAEGVEVCCQVWSFQVEGRRAGRADATTHPSMHRQANNPPARCSLRVAGHGNVQGVVDSGAQVHFDQPPRLLPARIAAASRSLGCRRCRCCRCAARQSPQLVQQAGTCPQQRTQAASTVRRRSRQGHGANRAAGVEWTQAAPASTGGAAALGLREVSLGCACHCGGALLVRGPSKGPSTGLGGERSGREAVEG